VWEEDEKEQPTNNRTCEISALYCTCSRISSYSGSPPGGFFRSPSFGSPIASADILGFSNTPSRKSSCYCFYACLLFAWFVGPLCCLPCSTFAFPPCHKARRKLGYGLHSLLVLQYRVPLGGKSHPPPLQPPYCLHLVHFLVSWLTTRCSCSRPFYKSKFSRLLASSAQRYSTYLPLFSHTYSCRLTSFATLTFSVLLDLHT